MAELTTQQAPQGVISKEKEAMLTDVTREELAQIQASRKAAQLVKGYMDDNPHTHTLLDIHSISDLIDYINEHKTQIEAWALETLAPIAQAELQALHMRVRPNVYR